MPSTSEYMDRWPITRTNTVVNICPQGTKMVIERFGKMHAIQDSGMFILTPCIDSVSYVIDMREQCILIEPQSAITKDNVSVQVSGNLYVQFTDAQKGAYGANNPLYSVRQFAESTMRSAIGELELDQILHARAALNKMISAAVEAPAANWGLHVKRYEITEIKPDLIIRTAMDKQAAAEREKREQVLLAEGKKTSMSLQSEGVKTQLINESEGHLIKVQNEAKANKDRLVLEAQGQAEAVSLAANAQAQALEVVAAAISKPGGAEAAQLAVAAQYIQMYGRMGERSNTMIFTDKPGDVNSLLAQAQSVLGSMAGNGAKVAPATNLLR